MLFLKLVYGAELGLGLLNCICLQETTTSMKSIGTQASFSLGFPSCKPVKVLDAYMCTHTFVYKHIQMQKPFSTWSEYLSSVVIPLSYLNMKCMLYLLEYFVKVPAELARYLLQLITKRSKLLLSSKFVFYPNAALLYLDCFYSAIRFIFLSVVIEDF